MNDAAKEALQALFLAFPAQERTGNERELVKVYRLALEGVDGDFVAMACKRFIQGRVDRSNSTFRPSPPELAIEARRLQGQSETLSQYARLPSSAPQFPMLPEPEVTPETRARVGEEMAKLKDTLEMSQGHPVPLLSRRKRPGDVKLSKAAKAHLERVKAMNEAESV